MLELNVAYSGEYLEKMVVPRFQCDHLRHKRTNTDMSEKAHSRKASRRANLSFFTSSPSHPKYTHTNGVGQRRRVSNPTAEARAAGPRCVSRKASARSNRAAFLAAIGKAKPFLFSFISPRSRKERRATPQSCRELMYLPRPCTFLVIF